MARSLTANPLTSKLCENKDFEADFFKKYLNNDSKDRKTDFLQTGPGKHDIVIPKPLKGAVSLSDIIAATIGEEARSCDMVTTNEMPDDSFDFLRSICDEPHGSNSDCVPHGYSADKSTQGTLVLDTNNDCFLTSEISTNSCDVLAAFQQQNNTENLAQSDAGVELVTNEQPFPILTELAFDSQINFLSPGFGQPSADDGTQTGALVSTPTSTGIKTTPTTDDSDLEDSLHFVDPDDHGNDLLNTPATHLADDKSDKTEDAKLEPEAKKPRLCDIDTNSCPPLDNNDFLSDCNPQFLAFLNGNDDLHNKTGFGCSNFYSMKTPRGRSFSGNPNIGLARPKPRGRLNDKRCKLTPKNLLRTRSFSEACQRPQVSPTQQENVNSSFSSVLQSPENESLSQNPMFDDLKSTLLSECQSLDCPQSLFDTLSSTGSNRDVYARERGLQSKFSSLQGKYPEEVSTLSAFYHKQSAEVETERLNEIHDENLPKSFRKHLNSYYDDQLHKIMDRVEKSLGLLSAAMRDIAVNRLCRPRTQFSRKAVEMMEEWLLRNHEHPYPSATAIEALAKAGELTAEQVKKWFANKRNRSKINKTTTEGLGLRRKRQFSARW